MAHTKIRGFQVICGGSLIKDILNKEASCTPYCYGYRRKIYFILTATQFKWVTGRSKLDIEVMEIIKVSSFQRIQNIMS